MHIAIENDFLYNGAQRIAYLRICLEQTQDNICGRIQTESNVRFEVDMEIKQWRMLTGQSICVLLLLLVFCVIFSKEMPIDSISKVQAQEAKESVLSESTRTRAQKLSDPKQDDASKKSQYVIVLDAGHGGKDEGAVSDDGKLEEKEYNLAVVKEIARLLEQSGVKVYCTRTTDRTVSKKARVRLANKRQADMLVSVHCNASDARKHFVRGIEVLYSKRDNGAGYTNKQLAAKLLKKTVAATGLPARGVIRREDLYLMHHAKVLAVIVETGYLTNPSDCLYMRQEKGIRQTAWGIYQAVMETLEKY